MRKSAEHLVAGLVSQSHQAAKSAFSPWPLNHGHATKSAPWSWTTPLQRKTSVKRLSGVLLNSSPLYLDVYLDFISQAPLQHMKPNGYIPANGMKRCVMSMLGLVRKMHVSFITSFPSASWTLNPRSHLSMTIVISPKEMVEPKHQTPLWRKPLTHLTLASEPGKN